jgi:hypothetical protein
MDQQLQTRCYNIYVFCGSSSQFYCIHNIVLTAKLRYQHRTDLLYVLNLIRQQKGPKFLEFIF